MLHRLPTVSGDPKVPYGYGVVLNHSSCQGQGQVNVPPASAELVCFPWILHNGTLLCNRLGIHPASGPENRLLVSKTAFGELHPHWTEREHWVLQRKGAIWRCDTSSIRRPMQYTAAFHLSQRGDISPNGVDVDATCYSSRGGGYATSNAVTIQSISVAFLGEPCPAVIAVMSV